MPKPKKGEIFATFNNDFAYDKGLARLQQIKGITLDILDSHTIKVTLKKKNDQDLELLVKFAVTSSKGYVEHDLENINAIQSKKEKRSEYGVLDTPFYG